MDAFSLSKTISTRNNEDEQTILVAKGKSYLSYFYVGVCSSVLYLTPEATPRTNMILSQHDEDSNYCDCDTSASSSPIVLEIYYHKLARAIDLQWATTKFIESNLSSNINKITNLSPRIQQQIIQFNNLYQNINIGDRYTLQYIPKIGIRLLLNDKLLGIVGNDMQLGEQHELARLIYSVWFGKTVPFSEPMKKELLTPFDDEVPVLIDIEDQSTREKEPTIISNTIGTAVLGNTILATDSKQSTPLKNYTTMTEEESKIFESIGILHLLNEVEEEEDKASDTPPVEHSDSSSPLIHQTSQSIDMQDRNDGVSTDSSSTLSRVSMLSRIRNGIFPQQTTSPMQDVEKMKLDKVVTASADSHEYDTTSLVSTVNSDDGGDDQYRYNPILLGIGGMLFLFPHLAVMLSLPPVLQRKGAPYLPTFGKKLNVMFDLIRNHMSHSQYMQHKRTQLRFVDLGSGDGRVVFRAAREGLFDKSVGYEINPALHIFANFRRLITPRYWTNTQFYMRDLWKIPLHQYDVVAVYGLSPIMQRLGTKLEKELKPGSIVLSNVFAIPGWRVSDTSASGGKEKEGVYLYQVPHCFGKKTCDEDKTGTH